MKEKSVLLLVLIAMTLTPSYGQRKKIVYNSKVELLNGSIAKGYLIALRDSSIQIRLKASHHKDTLFTIDRVNVVSLQRRSAKITGLLAGWVTGGLIGLAVTPAPECSDPFCGNVIFDPVNTGLRLAGGALIGAVVGGGIGMAVGSIYREFAIHGDIGLYQNLINKLPSKQAERLQLGKGSEPN